MPPFQYPGYENRQAGSIADLMLRRGDIAASGIAARGNAIAGGLQSIGQTVAAVPGQIEAADTRALQKRGLQLQVDAEQRSADDLKAIDAAYTQEGGRDKVIGALPGHLRGRVMSEFAASDKAHLEAQELRERADRLQVESTADMAALVRDHGYDPAALQIAISDRKLKYAGDPQTLSILGRMEEQLHANPTVDTVKGIVDPLINLSPKRREEAEKVTEQTQRKANEDAIRTETARHDKEVERITALREGREEAAQKETARHNGVVEGIERTNASTAQAREHREQSVYEQTYGAGAKNPDGTDKAPVISPTAKLIAEYRLPPVSARSAASGPGKAMMDQVAAYNPSYDGSQYATRAAMRKAYTSGNQSQQLTALNTAIEHLGKLDELAKAMHNGSFQPGNELYNWMRTTFGQSAVTNFDFGRDILAGELATAMKKSGATDPEIEKVSKALKSSASADQLADAIRVVAVPMIGGKASTLDQQYKQTMGDKDPFSVYTPGAKHVLETLGAGGKGGAAPKEGDIVPITDPGYPPGAEKTFKGGKWIRTK